MSEGSGLIIRPMAGFVQALQQLYAAPPDTIRNIDPNQWGSPLQPVKPLAPDGTEPRGMQFWFGQNMLYTPRPDAEYSATQLKILATYPLARICIENVKDMICKLPWEIQLRQRVGESKKDLVERQKKDSNLTRLNDFFECPDGENLWPDWLRPLLEDMLVIDAGSILIRKTFKGEVVQLRVIRGESIVRLIDQNGWTPQAPDPAYQQIWWGIPLTNLTMDQLIYRPRNIVPRNSLSSQLYGMSPTEQLAAEIIVGMKRLEFVTDYYTAGSMPGVIHVVPKGTPPDKISETMQWMNSELAGNLAARQQWRMIPGFNSDGKPDQILFPKEPLLADAFDEMHIRKVCFGYGTSPQRLMRMLGTRNAEQQQRAAFDEGILPWVVWAKSGLDFIIQRKMGLKDYEIAFDTARENDPKTEAEVSKTYVGSGLRTINEDREMRGEAARSEPEASMLGIITGSGFVPISGAGALTAPAPDVAAGGLPGKAAPDGGGGISGGEGGGGSKEKPNGTGTGKAHCRGHKAYDAVCVSCARAEVRRLERLAPSLTTAVSRSRTSTASPHGAVGFYQPTSGSSATVVASDVIASSVGATLLYSSEKVKKREAPFEFGSTQVDLPRFAEFAKLQAKIDPQDLESHGLEPDVHITVCWGLTDPAAAASDLVQALQDVGSFELRFGVTAKFEPGEHSAGACPLYVTVTEGAEELAELNRKVRETTDVKASDFLGYVPHLTVAYLKPDVVDRYVGFDDLVGVKMVVDSVVVVDREGRKTKIALGSVIKARHHVRGRRKVLLRGGAVSSSTADAIKKLETILKRTYGKMREKIVAVVERSVTFAKVKGDPVDELLREILADLGIDYASIPDDVKPALEQAALTGVSHGVAQLELSDEAMVAAINDVARDWASQRSAELVGMRRLDDGRIVENPNAEWTISDTQRTDIKNIITDAFTRESTKDEVAAAIRESAAFSDARAEMVARTELISSEVNGNLLTWVESGMVETVDWVMSADHDVDDVCDQNADEGPYDVAEVPDFPAHPNCCLAGTLVSSGGRLAAHVSRWYEGEVVTLSIKGIGELTLTPNHPVLTDYGWVRAGELKQGANLVSSKVKGVSSTRIDPNDYHMPTCIEDVANTLLKTGGMQTSSMPTAAKDFHGDGIVEGQVDIVWSTSFLRGQWNILKQAREFSFEPRRISSAIFNSESTPTELIKTGVRSTSRDVSGLSVSSTLGRGKTSLVLDVRTKSKTSFKEHMSNSCARTLKALSKIVPRFPTKVALVELTNISRRKFSGHVYNLTTEFGWYTANTIITHNCECVLIAGAITEQKARTSRKKRR